MYGDWQEMDVYVWRLVGIWTSMYGDKQEMDVYVSRQVGDGRLCMATGRRWMSMYGDRQEMDVYVW